MQIHIEHWKLSCAVKVQCQTDWTHLAMHDIRTFSNPSQGTCRCGTLPPYARLDPVARTKRKCDLLIFVGPTKSPESIIVNGSTAGTALDKPVKVNMPIWSVTWFQVPGVPFASMACSCWTLVGCCWQEISPVVKWSSDRYGSDVDSPKFHGWIQKIESYGIYGFRIEFMPFCIFCGKKNLQY